MSTPLLLAGRSSDKASSDIIILILLHGAQAISLLPALLGVLLAVGAASAGKGDREQWLAGSSRLSLQELALTASWVCFVQIAEVLRLCDSCQKATLSGYHSYCLARGLCIRWLTFYSLPSTLIRSLSLQAFAFPLTHWSLTFLCRSQPLAGWTLCALTSLFSDILKIWVLSSLRDLTGIRKRELLKQRKGGPQSVTVRARELRLGTVLHKGLPASILLVISNVALLFTLAEIRGNV